MTDITPIDPKALDLLLSLEADRPGSIRELVRMFIGDAPNRIQLVEDGYGLKDPEQLRPSAHFLRSGAMALGLTRLAETSYKIERLEPEAYGEPESDACVLSLRVELHHALMTLLHQFGEV